MQVQVVIIVCESEDSMTPTPIPHVQSFAKPQGNTFADLVSKISQRKNQMKDAGDKVCESLEGQPVTSLPQHEAVFGDPEAF